MPMVQSQTDLNIFANKGNQGKRFGHLFITSSSSHFFSKTDFEQLLLQIWIQYYRRVSCDVTRIFLAQKLSQI